MHIKRKAMPRTWPIKKQEGKYITVGKGKNLRYSIPIMVLLRDMLGIAKTKREVRNLLQKKQILVNNKKVKKPYFAVGLFDIIEIPKLNKNFIVSLKEGGKISIEEKKQVIIAKVIGKKIIKGEKQQINFFNGGNIISQEKVKVGDSVMLKDKKIIKVLPVEKGQSVIVIKGKHIGQRGKIEQVNDREIIVKTKQGEIKTNKENIFVIK